MRNQNNRITYHTFRQKRRELLLTQITPQLSEKLDRIEQQLLDKELLHRKTQEPVRQEKVSPWDRFSTGELKNPVTMHSFIEMLINRNGRLVSNYK